MQQPAQYGGFVEPGARAAKPRNSRTKCTRTSGKAARKINSSSRFLCPRSPLLLSAPNQNRHATQARHAVMIPEIKTRFYTLPYLHDTRAANDRSSFCKITFRKIDKEQILPLKLKKGYNFLDNTLSVRLRYSEFFYNSLRPTINFRRLCLSHLLPR